MTLPAGTRLGTYQILAPIGEGGMGQVYRARDTQLDRDVALKVLPEAFAADPDRLMRFTREAKTLASLNHPNIASIYGIEAQASGSALIMELVDGEDLSARIARGAIPLAEALPIARQIAEALEAAHEAGIVHRDLKPANIKLRDDGTVKVLDFGLAKAMTPEPARTAPGPFASGPSNSPTFTSPAMTALGVILGTAAYMAPEQARGKTIDRRVDVWAFGAVLFEMLTGQRAFEGDDISITLANVLKDDVKWEALPGDLPTVLRRVLRRCLVKNPAKRLNSMRAVALEIDDILAGNAETDESPRFAPPAPRRMRRLVLVGAFLGAVVAGLVAGVASHDRWLPGPARVTEVTYQPITFDTGFVYAARFARDARTVVYSADWDGRARDVFVTSIDSRNARPFGLPGTDLLALGPSGEMVVLLNSTVATGNPYVRRGALARSTITGGTPRAEIEGVLYADIAPDGTLAVVRDVGAETVLEYPAGQVVARLSKVSGAYTTSIVVTPRISPDGEHVAIMAPVGASLWRTRIYRRGGGLAMEDASPLSDWWGLAWRNASELWISGAEAQGRQTSLFALTLAGRRRVVLRAPGAYSLHDVAPHGDVLVSFDRFGRLVEYVSAAGEQRDITWQDGGGGAGLADNGLVLVDQDGDGGGPHGTALAWPRGASEPIRIAEGLARAVSMDGRLAFVLRDGGQSIVPIGPGQSRSIDYGPIKDFGWTGWHPDGRLVVEIVRPDESHGTYAVDAKGGSPVPFLPAGFSLSGGRLIPPDGRHVIATAPGGEMVLCAIPAAVCPPLPGTKPGDEAAGWLADNRTLVVFNGRALPAPLETIDTATGKRTPWKTLRPLQPALGGIRQLIVAPDGSMMLAYDRVRTELNVIRGLR